MSAKPKALTVAMLRFLTEGLPGNTPIVMAPTKQYSFAHPMAAVNAFSHIEDGQGEVCSAKTPGAEIVFILWPH